MAEVKFLDILGIDRNLSNIDRFNEAAAMWPGTKVNFILGEHNDSASLNPLMEYLQDSLIFKAVRPGSSPDRVGLSAEIEITNPFVPRPLVLRSMPDVAFFLQDTENGKPARCYITRSDTGNEIVIEALPVEIRLPTELITPIKENNALPPLFDEFISGIYDSYKVELNENEPSSLFVHIKLRITEEWDFIIEPAVVLSVGPCIFSGLPCFGLHDISLIHSPTLVGDDHAEFEQALEWTRHTIEPADFGGGHKFRGCISVRTIDLDHTLSPLKEVNEWLNPAQGDANRVQFVMEDVVIPFFNILPLPLPIHGSFGIRRNIEIGDSLSEAYSFSGAPIQIKLGGLLILIEEFLIESFNPKAIEIDNIPRFQISLTRGELPKTTTLNTTINKDVTSLIVGDGKIFPNAPFTIVIDASDDDKKEYIHVNSKTDNQLGVLERGYNNTVASKHDANAEIRILDKHAITLGFTEEWTGQAGYRYDEGYFLFTLGGNQVKFTGGKIGLSFKRIYESVKGLKEFKWYNYFQLLFDLSIEVKPSDSTVFRIEKLNGKSEPEKEILEIPLRNVGWNLDGISLDGFSLPEGVQIIFGKYFKLIVHEVAIQVDKNGGTYFSVTGGLAIISDKFNANIIVHRLRLRIAGNPNASFWLLDGITFELKINSFELLGSGIAGEFIKEGHTYNELQFALAVKFEAFSKEFGLALSLFKGEVSGPVDNFKYWMFGFSLVYIPIGSLDLYNLRALGANNLAPNLPPPDGDDQHLRVFKWYKNASEPMALPTTRKMNAWLPQDDSFAFGVGAGATFGGNTVLLLDLFVFHHKSPSESGLMIAFELFIFESKKAIGFAVVEIDFEHGKWAFFMGVQLSFSNILPEGKNVPGLENVAALSGTLYMGNKPNTFALGQLTDQDTWLGFRMKEDRFFKLDIVLAMCIHFVDRPAGPKGFGALVSAKGGASFGIGKASFYFMFLFIAGIWKNESSASGLILLFEAGFRIKLFRVFSFGASVKIQIDFLGPNPEYKRLGFEIHVDTPWYLPDVNFRFEKIYSSPEPEEQDLISSPIISTEALQLAVEQPTPLLLTPVQGELLDERALFNLRTIRNLNEVNVAQSSLDNLVAVGVDSTIILNFKPPVDDKLSIGEITPLGAGNQKATPPAENEMAIRYELISLSIRRQARYGSTANQWTSLLAPEDTEITDLENWPVGSELEALFSSHLQVHWDRDVMVEGRLDPRRLLINAETPFTLITANAEADESILINQPGWPCCTTFGTSDTTTTWHRIIYAPSLIGQRAPNIQVFSDSQSTLRWFLSPVPLIIPALLAPGDKTGVRVHLNPAGGLTFATISFDEPIFQFQIEVYWSPQHRKADVVLEAYHGLEVVNTKTLSLLNPQLGIIKLIAPEGFTTIQMKFIDSEGVPSSALKSDWIEIIKMEYRTIDEEKDGRTNSRKCKENKDKIIGGKGKLAWLPNHNYEIKAKTRVVLQHNQTGEQEGEIVQKTYFRTKGLIGLNAVERIGQEVEPYIEAVYPKIDTPIVYREEPILIAFKEQFNILLPVDKNLSPNNPAELNQILEWDITVDKERDSNGQNRISKSNPDWIIENRGSGVTNPFFDISILLTQVFTTYVRKAPSINPLVLRVDNILSSPSSCNTTIPTREYPSQILMHQAFDPSISANTNLWEANTFFKANLKPKGAPMIHRRPFEAADITSFTQHSQQGLAPNSWLFADGQIILSENVDQNKKFYALFGEEDWDYIQVRVELNPGMGMAGVAVGVAATIFGVHQGLLVLVDDINRQLKVLKLANGNLQTLNEIAIPDDILPPFHLEVVGYDDLLKVNINDTSLLVEREEIRNGRLALVAEGVGSFSSLTVEGLDAYQFYFQSSRFASFEDHILSFNAPSQIIKPDVAQNDPFPIIQELFTSTAQRISEVMTPNSTQPARLTLFQEWAEALELPFYENPDRLKISRLENGQGTVLILLESPEPLRISTEVKLTLAKETKVNAGCLSVINPLLKLVKSNSNLSSKFLEKQIRRMFPEVNSIDIQNKTINARVESTFLNIVKTPPKYALINIRTRAFALKRILELRYKKVAGGKTEVVATVLSVINNPTAEISRVLGKLLGTLNENELIFLDKNRNNILRMDIPPNSDIQFVDQSFLTLSNGVENKILLIPTNQSTGQPIVLGGGKYRLNFNIKRRRYEQILNDVNAVYSKNAEITINW